jgi:hypothetical protein
VAVTNFIEFVCREHTESDRIGPLITRVDGKWAYCEGRANDGHLWTRTEPTRRDQIGDISRVQERQAS